MVVVDVVVEVVVVPSGWSTLEGNDGSKTGCAWEVEVGCKVAKVDVSAPSCLSGSSSFSMLAVACWLLPLEAGYLV